MTMSKVSTKPKPVSIDSLTHKGDPCRRCGEDSEDDNRGRTCRGEMTDEQAVTIMLRMIEMEVDADEIDNDTLRDDYFVEHMARCRLVDLARQAIKAKADLPQGGAE